MGPLHKRLQVVALSSVLVPSAIGVVAVHASPTCERVVRTYVTVPVRNQVSKATAIAWAKWRVGHPDWKPNPHVTRPKYVMTRKEAMKKVEVACEVPIVPATLDMALTPRNIDTPPGALDLGPMEGPKLVFPDEAPPLVSMIPPEDTPLYGGPPNSPSYPGGGGGGGGIPGIPGVPPVIPTGPTTTGTSVTPPDVPPVLPPGTPPPVAATPEPSSILLLVSGLAGVWLCWARRAELEA